MQPAHHHRNRFGPVHGPAQWALVAGVSLGFVANLALIVTIAAGRFGSS
jgi:hypothetical protein